MMNTTYDNIQHDEGKCPISLRMDTLFSTSLILLTTILLGAAYYLFYVKLEMFPAIYIAALLFGFSCMGLIRMWKLREHG